MTTAELLLQAPEVAPEPLPGPTLAWPKPLAPEAFHGVAGDIVRAIEPHSEADPVALLATTLAMFGAAAGSNSYASVERDKHPPRLFVAIVGESSKSRKGTSAGWPRYLLTRADDTYSQRIIDGLASGEGLIWQVRDPIVKSVPVKEAGRITGYQEETVDPGVSDKRLMVLEGELARILRVLPREGNTLSTVIRCAWDIGDLNSATKNTPARATGAHIAIVGHITHAELQATLTEVETANGFGNRFLWLCARRSKVLPFGGELHAEALEPYAQYLREAMHFAQQGHIITWAPATRSLWAAIYPELSEGKPGLIGALTARSEAQVLRLAVTYALLDLSDRIKPEHLKAALAVWQYAEDSVRHLFQNRLGNPLADRILRELMNRTDGMTRTELRDALSRHGSAVEIEQALQLLAAHDLAYGTKQETPGRPREVWRVGREDAT